MDEKQVAKARRMHASNEYEIQEICDALNVSKPTLYRYLRGTPHQAPKTGRDSNNE